MIQQYDHLFKIVFVGGQGVGKSAIFLRFSENNYVEKYSATIGVDFKFKTLDIDRNQVKLQIWDTAGQERFRTITSAYYRGSHAIVIVYDMSNEESFYDVENFWVNEIKTFASPDVKLVFMGSKSDLPKRANQSIVDGLVSQLNIKCYEVSAKTGQGVMEAFEDICKDLIRVNVAKKKKDTNKLAKTQENVRLHKKCC